MSRARISQRGAHRLKKRVEALEQQARNEHAAWTSDYPGVSLGSITMTAESHAPSKIETARRLGWATVCVAEGQTVRFYAVKP